MQGGRLLLDYQISIELQSLLYQTVKIRVIVNMSAECIACQNPIRARQQGLQFDSCFRRQHRTCGTGIPVWLPFCWASWCFHRLALCYLSVHVAVWEYACRWEYACWLHRAYVYPLRATCRSCCWWIINPWATTCSRRKRLFLHCHLPNPG